MTAHGFGSGRYTRKTGAAKSFLSDEEIEAAAEALADLAGVPKRLSRRHIKNASMSELERLDEHLRPTDCDVRLVPTDDNTAVNASETTDAEPDTSCPKCGNEQTVGFSTGDRVCKKCNTNFVPGEDE